MGNILTIRLLHPKKMVAQTKAQLTAMYYLIVLVFVERATDKRKQYS